MLASDEIWVYVICSSKAGKQKPAGTEGGDVTPLATVIFVVVVVVFNPRGGMEEMSFAVDICWIPHRANDIMQRFLNKLYPAWGEKRAIRPSTCGLQHQGSRPERRWGTHQGMFDPSIKQWWLMSLCFYATDLLQLKNNNLAWNKIWMRLLILREFLSKKLIQRRAVVHGCNFMNDDWGEI